MQTATNKIAVHALKAAVLAAGGQMAFARALRKKTGRNIQQGHVSFWLHGSKKGLPPDLCLLVERLYGIPREKLRPDVYLGKNGLPP